MSVEISRRRLITLTAGIAAVSTASLLARRDFLESGQSESQATLTPTSTPTSESTVTPTPTPEKPALSVEMAALREKLSAEIEAYQGQTAIAVTDVISGETIDVNGNRPQLPGCVANLVCALTAISELSRNIALFTKDDIEPDLTIMVRHSNPTAGLKIVTAIGGGNVEEGVKRINLSMKQWGMYKSSYDHPPAFETTFSAHGDSNWFVANETNSVLTRVAAGKLFAKNGSDWNLYALWVMSNNKPGLNFMIPAQIPQSDATVFHKVGWVPGLPNTINDSAVISANDHRFLYVITFMYQNFQNPASEDSLFAGPGPFGSKLSKITYDMFRQKYSG